jgi:hypothetical protein
MTNKVTVFEFVTEFNNFYNNILHIVEEEYNENKVSRFYLDIVYDKLSNYKNEIERTLEARVLSVDKSGKMLMEYMDQFVKIAENCLENYELVNNNESYNAYVFLNSIVDCYNELCEELGYN